MGTIHLLDDITISQIAAGEVIENGASVVKELVDNALDAGASSIFIEIKGGGRQLIRVTDNGKGMSSEDALLCFQRHATSKISHLEDLNHLATNGFRGEALAAIASVSKVKLMSRLANEPLGTLIVMEGGRVISQAAVNCEAGTTLEVAELFYNTPARKNFLKSPSSEASEIHKQIISLSLSHPETAFCLIGDGEKIYEVTATFGAAFSDQLKKRALHLYGLEEEENLLLPLQSEFGNVKVEGWLGHPALHRPHRTGQYFFVNGRPVYAWSLSQAVTEGYSSSLPEKRHPIYVIHLTIPPSDVDVNVHPQKKEVRFRKEWELKERLKKAISQSLLNLGGALPSYAAPLEPSPSFVLPLPPLKEEVTVQAYQPAPATRKYESFVFVEPPRFSQESSILNIPPRLVGLWADWILLDRLPFKDEGEGLAFLDILGAKSRICYERHQQEETSSQGSQRVMTPIVLKLEPLKKELLRHTRHEFEKLGFLFDGSAESLLSIPSTDTPESAVELLYELMDRVEAQGEIAIQRSIEKRTRNEKQITWEEAEGLLKELAKCQQPYFSPKGAPLYGWLPASQVPSLFKPGLNDEPRPKGWGMF